MKYCVGIVLFFMFFSCSEADKSSFKKDTTELKNHFKSTSVDVGVSIEKGSGQQSKKSLNITINDPSSFNIAQIEKCQQNTLYVLDFFYDEWIGKAYSNVNVIFRNKTGEQQVITGTYSEIANEMIVYYLEEGQDAKAVKLADKLVESSPKDPDYIFSRAFVYSKTGDRTKAIEQMKAALALRPDDANFKLNLAVAYELDSQYVKSEELLEAIIKEDFRNDDALMELGFVKLKLNKPDEALKSLKDVSGVYELKDKHDRLLALAYSESNKKDSALAIIERVLSRDSSAVTFRTAGKIFLKIDEKRACQYLKQSVQIGDKEAGILLNEHCR